MNSEKQELVRCRFCGGKIIINKNNNIIDCGCLNATQLCSTINDLYADTAVAVLVFIEEFKEKWDARNRLNNPFDDDLKKEIQELLDEIKALKEDIKSLKKETTSSIDASSADVTIGNWNKLCDWKDE